MPEPTFLDETDLATLRAELAGPTYAGMSDSDRFAAINNPPRVPNPEPPPQVPAPIDQDALLAALASSSAGVDRLNNYPHLDHVLQNLNDNDLASLRRWFTLLTGGTSPVITPEHAATVQAMLAATRPDPDWPATVPGVSRKAVLFGAKTWAATIPLADGATSTVTHDFIPLADIVAARTTPSP